MSMLFKDSKPPLEGDAAPATTTTPTGVPAISVTKKLRTVRPPPLTFGKVFRDCITENDGMSVCPFRLCGLLMSLTGIVLFAAATVVSLVHAHPVDLVQFGIGFGSMMAGVAVLAGGVALKATTDTDARTQP
jgi:hypothetical protein